MNLWQISEDTFDPEKLLVGETIFTIGNGYFGTRGSFEEGYPRATPATLLYGVFDKIDVGKEELANAPDWLPIKLFINGERFRLDRGIILDYHRSLDIQNGLLRRSVHWESPTGVRVRVNIERFASLADEHVGAIRYSVTLDEQSEYDEDFQITLWASLNTAVGNYDLMHWETVDQGHNDLLLWLHTETRHSTVQLVQTMSFCTERTDFYKETIDSDIAPSIRLNGRLKAGETIMAEKIVTMYTSRDTLDPLHTAIKTHSEMLGADENHPQKRLAPSLITETSTEECEERLPFQGLLGRHQAEWGTYWEVSDMVIEGDEISQQAVRYNIYQLRISTSWNDDRYSIAAKGLTGFGYRGHVFHDTEIFMLPFFMYVHPRIARNLLLYRYRLLNSARIKATRYGYEGAQFPWESTIDGDETTPESIIHPESGEIIPVLNGHIELHITASISLAVWHYWQVTGDDPFMCEYGAEILLSTATFWASRAEYNARRDDYEITNVIGPDEWHEYVNNNAYTNYMARWNIQAALTILDWLKTHSPQKAEELIERLDLNHVRLALWRKVIEQFYIPQDKASGLFEQFDGFFKLERFDQSKYKNRTASYQALLGMDQVQRLQLLKQADVLMLLTVLNDAFDLKTKRINWDYYYPITDHDFGSSLTPALHSIIACELGLVDTAYELFLKGALVDLKNLRKNTPEGIHNASAGAVWQAVVFGFAGLGLHDDTYTLHPCWPDGWTRLAFTCFHKGQHLHIDLHKPQ